MWEGEIYAWLLKHVYKVKYLSQILFSGVTKVVTLGRCPTTYFFLCSQDISILHKHIFGGI